MAKSKSRNGKTSSQDYTNLLYSDTDSDTVPDLRLPPLKGKKTKRHTLQNARRSTEGSTCSVWTAFKIATVTILLSSIVALGIITYWSLQQLNELKSQINELENKNARLPEEYQALQSKLVLVNRTLTEVRTGRFGLAYFNKSIESMKKQITSLTETTTKLQDSVASFDPHNKETVAVANTVAQIGSDLKSTSSRVDALKTSQNDFNGQLEALTNRISALENPVGREGPASTAEKVDVQGLLGQLNASLTQGLGQAVINLNKLQTHMNTVDLFTQGMQDQLKAFAQQVAELNQTQQQLVNATQNKAKTDNDAQSEGTQVTGAILSSIKELQDQYEHVQQSIEQMQSSYSNLTAAGANSGDGSSLSISQLDLQELKKDHEDLINFKTQLLQTTDNMNTSISQLNGTVSVVGTDIDNLYAKVNATIQDLSNITMVMTGLVEEVRTLSVANAAGNGEAKENVSPPTDASGGKRSTPAGENGENSGKTSTQSQEESNRSSRATGY